MTRYVVVPLSVIVDYVPVSSFLYFVVGLCFHIMLCNLFHSIMKSSLLAYAPRFIVPFQKREMKKWKCFVLTLNSLKNKAINFEMRFGHVCLSKNDFPKKINLIFCLFLLSLATQSLKINFSSFFHPGQGSPLHWGLVHYFSISIIIRFTGGYFAIYLICLPHWGLTQFEYCSSKCLGSPLH